MSKTVLDWLIETFPRARKQTLRRMVENGRVVIAGRPVKSVRHSLVEGESPVVLDHPASRPAGIDPLKTIHEDEDVLVVFKPAGLLTSTVPREKRQTAIGLIRAYLADRDPAARPGVVHRLDREASGLLVFSKNSGAFQSLKRQFFAHTVDRVYTAVVEGKPSPPAGRIRSRLVELPDGKVKATKAPKKGQVAVSEYQVLRVFGGMSLVRVTLQTGRKHQIRAHLSERGWPIVGDVMYGAKTGIEHGLQLAATSLAFDHPRTKRRMSFQLPLPPSMRKLVKES